MRNNRRTERINDEVRREIAEIIRSELKDPRVSVLTSVIRTEVTADFKYCKVYVSSLEGESGKDEIMAGLNNAKGFIRKLVAERINLRQTPEITFIYDDMIEHGIRISKIISEFKKE